MTSKLPSSSAFLLAAATMLTACDNGALKINGGARDIKLPPRSTITLEVAADDAAFVKFSLTRESGSRDRAKSCAKRTFPGIGPTPVCGSLELVDAPQGKFVRMESQYGGAITAYPNGGRAKVKLTNLSRHEMTWALEAVPPID